MTPTPEDIRRFELNMIPYEEWGRAPEKAAEIAKYESSQGVPTGITHDEVFGWVVIQSSGQGPYVIWDETYPVIDPEPVSAPSGFRFVQG